MRRILLLLLLFSLAATSGSAFPLMKRKKKAQSSQTEKKSAYERALTEQLTESVRGSFVSFHKTDGRLLMELPKSRWVVTCLLASLSRLSLIQRWAT